MEQNNKNFIEAGEIFNITGLPCKTLLGLSREKYSAVLCDECEGEDSPPDHDHTILHLSFQGGIITREEALQIYEGIRETPNLIRSVLTERENYAWEMEFVK